MLATHAVPSRTSAATSVVLMRASAPCCPTRTASFAAANARRSVPSGGSSPVIAQDLGERVDGGARGDLAARQAADAVGDDEQAAAAAQRLGERDILVRRADEPDVGVGLQHSGAPSVVPLQSDATNADNHPRRSDGARTSADPEC